jgi:hypothetical protein
MKTTSPIGKPTNTPIVPLPEIPLEMRRETRPLEKNVEKMLLDMGFQPLTEEMRNRLIAAGHYGMPKE